MNKVEVELKKFMERCAKNPHGAEAAREKHDGMTERLQSDIKTQLLNRYRRCRVLQGVARCCRVLQGVARCCKLLQDVARCC